MGVFAILLGLLELDTKPSILLFLGPELALICVLRLLVVSHLLFHLSELRLDFVLKADHFLQSHVELRFILNFGVRDSVNELLCFLEIDCQLSNLSFIVLVLLCDADYLLIVLNACVDLLVLI